MNAIADIWNHLDWSVLTDMLLSVIPALLCITLHELGHGLAAWLLGDPTAKDAGRLTLNPIKHIDPLGTLMLVVFHFGYAKPVPVNMYNFKNPRRGMAVTALAGPVTNLLIAVVFLFLYGVCMIPLYYREAWGQTGFYLMEMLYLTAYISIGMGIFNLLPIPPLDGSKVLYSVISEEAYFKLMRYERYGMIALLVLAYTGVLGAPLSAAVSWVFGKLTVIAQYGFNLVRKLV